MTSVAMKLTAVWGRKKSHAVLEVAVLETAGQVGLAVVALTMAYCPWYPLGAPASKLDTANTIAHIGINDGRASEG